MPDSDLKRVASGVHLPNLGHWWREPGLENMAQLVEEAGFDSVWLSDHVVLLDHVISPYPFSTDGSFFLEPEADWLDWVVCAGYLAAVTERVEIGVGVCVLPLRQPLVLAKQVATLDQLSGGRMIMGVGAGWLEEEFDALGVDFRARGRTMDSAIRLMRAAWTGSPAAGAYGPWKLPGGVHCRPTPVRPVPIYIGGTSAAALRRVARHGEGWYGSAVGGHMAPQDLSRVRDRIAAECERIGRDPGEVEIAMRVAIPARELGTAMLEERLAGYVSAGVTRLSFDVGWRDPDRMKERLGRLLDVWMSARRGVY